MNIRLEGKESEMKECVDKIKNIFNIKSVSDFYRNKKKDGVSEYGRVYITTSDDVCQNIFEKVNPMEIEVKKINTRNGERHILKFKFKSDLDFDYMIADLKDVCHTMIKNGASAGVVGGFECFIQALFENYNSDYHNTMLWPSQVYDYNEYLIDALFKNVRSYQFDGETMDEKARIILNFGEE